MKKLVLASLGLMSAALSGSAFARSYTYSGVLCQPMGVSTSAVEYSQFGIDNTSAAPVTIECPLPLSFNGNAIANVTAASAVAYDRNTTSDVVCSLQVVNSLGNVLQSFNAQTSGGGPGSNFQPLTFPVSQAISSNYWRLHCTLPAIQSGALSHLTTYGLDTNE